MEHFDSTEEKQPVIGPKSNAHFRPTYLNYPVSVRREIVAGHFATANEGGTLILQDMDRAQFFCAEPGNYFSHNTCL
jgi:hypothetical protein